MKKLNETKFVKIEEKELNKIKGGFVQGEIFNPTVSLYSCKEFKERIKKSKKHHLWFF